MEIYQQNKKSLTQTDNIVREHLLLLIKSICKIKKKLVNIFFNFFSSNTMPQRFQNKISYQTT